MTCGLQDKSFAFYPCTYTLTYVFRMHIQDGEMHAAFDQNKSIYFKTKQDTE
jgi:hypothetical protein